MLAICCLCATLSKEDLLISLTDKGHSVIHQLKNCFKFEIDALYQSKNYVCLDCIKTLQTCDDFFKRIQRAQESLRILFKAKSQLRAEKTAKKVAGTIRVRDFCKIQVQQNDNCNELATDSTAETLNIHTADTENEKDLPEIEEYYCNKQHIADVTEIKVECEDVSDPLETNSNTLDIDLNEETADQSIVFENFLRNVFNAQSDVVHENIDNAELSISEESNFFGFDEDLDRENVNEEHIEQESLDENLNRKIKISIIKYQCETCSQVFPNEEQLQKHLRSHIKGRVFQCKDCLKIFNHASSLYYHAKIVHHTNSKEGNFRCGYCEKTFHRLNGLKAHLRTHSKENAFRCKICMKTFRHTSSLWYHMKAHANERQYQCQFCSKSYLRRKNLDAHLIAHQKNRLFICEICEKSFFGQRKLAKHIDEEHSKQIWRCKKCKNTFSTLKGLNNHQRWHNESLYTCEYCYKEFRSDIWYMTHLRSHSVSVRKQFKCGNCSGSFLNQRSLTAHTCGKAADE